MRSLRNSLLVVLLMTACVSGVYGRRVKVRHEIEDVEKALEPAEKKPPLCTAPDTLAALSCFGYDKPLSATRESFYVRSALTADTVFGIECTVRYRAMNGQELHQRTLLLPLTLYPGGATRVSFRSWDETRTHYYHKTPPRHSERFTPYRVEVTLTGLQLQSR